MLHVDTVTKQEALRVDLLSDRHLVEHLLLLTGGALKLGTIQLQNQNTGDLVDPACKTGTDAGLPHSVLVIIDGAAVVFLPSCVDVPLILNVQKLIKEFALRLSDDLLTGLQIFVALNFNFLPEEKSRNFVNLLLLGGLNRGHAIFLVLGCDERTIHLVDLHRL